jgi:predicted lipoprotein with Yx(FWY)xxD motif
MRHLTVVVATLMLSLAGSVFDAGRLLAEQGGGKMPPGVQTGKLASGMVVLTDARGMTLYTYQKDPAGKSVCNEQCAKNWPPLTAPADAKQMGDWTVVIRDDGTRQWAYKSRPLYTWIKDTKPSEATGHGVGNGVWEQAVP